MCLRVSYKKKYENKKLFSKSLRKEVGSRVGTDPRIRIRTKMSRIPQHCPGPLLIMMMQAGSWGSAATRQQRLTSRG